MTELVDAMRRSGAVVERDGRLCAATEYTPVDPATLGQPLPAAWPAAVEGDRP